MEKAWANEKTQIYKTTYLFGYQQIIEERKNEILAGHRNSGVNSKGDRDIGMKNGYPFIDLLIESHLQDPQSVSLESVQKEVGTFMFEGHDTTAVDKH